jgi:tetratricopeptide (TPR) repeat protein
MSLAELGRFAEASKYAAEAIQLAEPTQHTHTIGWAHLPASMIHLFRGDWAKVRSPVEHWLSMPGTLDVAILLPWAVATSAWALAQHGETARALSRAQQCEHLLDRQTARGIVGHRGWSYHALGRAYLLLGGLQEAERLGCRSVESSQRQPGFKAHGLHLLGDITTHPDRFDPESAAAYYREALALAKAHGMRALIAQCHLGLAKLYRRAGRPERAEQDLIRATTMLREMDMNSWLEQGSR